MQHIARQQPEIQERSDAGFDRWFNERVDWSWNALFKLKGIFWLVFWAFKKATLKKLNQSKYDFVFYIAGVDIHHNDRLGKLKITDEGINKRDQIVIENFYSKNIPLCGVLGGGYNNSFDKLIELHSMLHKNCAEYF